MAEAKKCDRCGGFYDHYKMDIKRRNINLSADGTVKIQECLSIRTEVFDLCPDCFENLIRFLGLLVEDIETKDDRQCEKCRHKVETKPGVEACDVWDCSFEPKDEQS